MSGKRHPPPYRFWNHNRLERGVNLFAFIQSEREKKLKAQNSPSKAQEKVRAQ